MKVVETERLVLRRIRVKDAAFVRELVNEPAWIRYIGDKGAKTLRDAENYIRRGPIDMYRRLGFGLYRVETSFRIGILCQFQERWHGCRHLGS